MSGTLSQLSGGEATRNAADAAGSEKQMNETTIEATTDRAPLHKAMPEQVAQWKAQADALVAHLGVLPRGKCDPDRWQVLLEDARRFAAAGWLDRAKDLGWQPRDLFGVDCLQPWDTPDAEGLLVALRGRAVVSMTTAEATLRLPLATSTDTYARRVPGPEQGMDPARITLVEQLAP
jgi:hypothetical protein